MKKTTLAAAFLVGMLGLAGCTSSPEAIPEEAGSAPTSAGSKSEPTETKAPPVDIKAAKAAAIESGRPEAAWDKNCVAWEMPEVDTQGQNQANKLGSAFLESKSAGCPDALTYPYYLIDSFAPGAAGELVVNVDPAINRSIAGTKPGYQHELQSIAEGVMAGIMDANPSVNKVTAQTPDGKRYGHTDRTQAEKARADGGLG